MLYENLEGKALNISNRFFKTNLTNTVTSQWLYFMIYQWWTWFLWVSQKFLACELVPSITVAYTIKLEIQFPFPRQVYLQCQFFTFLHWMLTLCQWTRHSHLNLLCALVELPAHSTWYRTGSYHTRRDLLSTSEEKVKLSSHTHRDLLCTSEEKVKLSSHTYRDPPSTSDEKVKIFRHPNDRGLLYICIIHINAAVFSKNHWVRACTHFRQVKKPINIYTFHPVNKLIHSLTSVTVPMGTPPCRTLSRSCKLVGKNGPFPWFLFSNSSKPCKITHHM